MAKKRILIVEDDAAQQARYKAALPEHEIVPAETWSDGLRLFMANKDSLDAIVLDGILGSNGLYGYELVQAIKATGYEGPIIAASGSATQREKMMQAGATYERLKPDVPLFLNHLLGR